MREAKVTCKTTEFTLKDLGVKLQEGQTVWFSVEKVKLSESLKLARRIGAVSLEWKERARVSKPPPPPNFRRLTPGQRKQVAQPDAKPAKPVAVYGVDQDALHKHVRAVVAGEVARHIEGLTAIIAEQLEGLRGDFAAQIAAVREQGQPGQQGQLDPETLTATLTAVIQASMPKTVTAGAAGATESQDTGPVYIPSGIVEQDVKIQGEVQMTEKTSEAGGAEAAAKKLRKLKQKSRDTK